MSQSRQVLVLLKNSIVLLVQTLSLWLARIVELGVYPFRGGILIMLSVLLSLVSQKSEVLLL